MISNDAFPKALAVFDEAAKTFADTTDVAIRHGTYDRAQHFAQLAAKYLNPHARLLDYGCGPGRISKRLAAAGFNTIGVDPSPQMIAEARMLIAPSERLDFSVLPCSNTGRPVLDACLSGNCQLPLANLVFDGIVCSSVIEYASDPQVFLSDLRQLLRPGGYLFVSYANRNSLWRHCARGCPLVRRK